MKEVREYGVDWIIRSNAVRETQYLESNITRYYQASPADANGNKLFPTTRRIGLSCPDNGSSACFATKNSLGFGTYEVFLASRLDGLDPNIIAAAWTHVDSPDPRPAGHVEVDFEVSPWGDPNRRNNRVQLGVFVDAKKPMVKAMDGTDVPKYPNVETGVPSFRYHKITISQFPHLSRVVAAGWWEGNNMWKDYVWGEWAVPSPLMGVFKVGLIRVQPNLYPTSWSMPAKIVLAGFKFTPA